MRTRPLPSHSIHSRWAASSSSRARRPICAAMPSASAANASVSACACRRCARLWSSRHVRTSPARSRDAAISSSGVSQTVSASGIASRSSAVSGCPSSSVKANRPPGRSAAAISPISASLSSKASIVSSRSTTSNGPAGRGGISATAKLQGRSPACSRAMATALALASTPRSSQPSSRVSRRPGPAMPQHRSSTFVPGPMPACIARVRISPAVMKLSCPTNSPGAYAATRARCERPVERRSVVLSHVDRHPGGKECGRACVRIDVTVPRTQVLGGTVQVGPAIGLIAQVAAARRPGRDRRARRRRLGRRPRLRDHHGDGTRARGRARSGCVAGPVVGDARPGHPRRRRRRAGRGLLRTRHAGRAARGAGRRRARAGPRRRLARAPHRDRDRAGRALRRRGRRVPDPRAQRLRRPHRRRVGARDRRGALPVPPRRVAAAVDARAAPAAPVAQGRRGRPGDRAHGRGGRRPAPVGHAGDPPRRARRPRGVRGRVRVVAVAPPARRARAAAPRDRRGVHGRSPCCWSGPRWSRRTR